MIRTTTQHPFQVAQRDCCDLCVNPSDLSTLPTLRIPFVGYLCRRCYEMFGTEEETADDVVIRPTPDDAFMI